MTLTASPRVSVDAPTNPAVTTPLLVRGWAVDAAWDGGMLNTGTGVEAAPIWAYSSLGSGQAAHYWGAATQGAPHVLRRPA